MPRPKCEHLLRETASLSPVLSAPGSRMTTQAPTARLAGAGTAYEIETRLTRSAVHHTAM